MPMREMTKKFLRLLIHAVAKKLVTIAVVIANKIPVSGGRICFCI